MLAAITTDLILVRSDHTPEERVATLFLRITFILVMEIMRFCLGRNLFVHLIELEFYLVIFNVTIVVLVEIVDERSDFLF